MICERCTKEIQEGKFILVPCQKRVPQGIINSQIHLVICDNCSINQRVVGDCKISQEV